MCSPTYIFSFQSGTGLISLDEFQSMVNRKHNHVAEQQGEHGQGEQEQHQYEDQIVVTKETENC